MSAELHKIMMMFLRAFPGRLPSEYGSLSVSLSDVCGSELVIPPGGGGTDLERGYGDVRP